MNQILINAAHEEEIRVAVVKNKTLVDLDIESNLNQKNKGNIYLGKISRIEESLEAAFVDYGKERQGFLPLKELCPFYYPDNKKQEKLSISTLLKEGQKIIVQVEKEERSNKGAALTTFINLVGTYMIFMPTKDNGVNISRQVRSSDRKELQDIVKKLDIADDIGIILRTIASGKSQEELQWEIDHLTGLWRSILKTSEKEAPFLIYQEGNIVIRSIRDYLRADIDSVIIDDLKIFQQVKEFVTFMLPHYLHKIKFFDISERSLFNHMGIEIQVNNVFKREVSLTSGGTIVFDATEALTAVDINSARANKGTNIEETAYNTNLEAAKEIANQLQLRDMGGLVVIDFIDMNSSEHKKSVEKALEKAVEKDRARTHIGKISSFCLLEMSRQRIRSSISEAIHKTCDKCNGSGVTATVPGLAVQILRQLENNCNAAAKGINEVIIRSTVEVITYLLNEKRHHIVALELKHKVRIILLPHGYKTFPYYDIKKKTIDSTESLQKSYQNVSKRELLPDILIKKSISDVPEISVYRPETPIPIRKISLFKRLINALFGQKKKQKKYSSSYRRQNNRNKKYRNQKRQKNQYASDDKKQQNKPNHKPQGNRVNNYQKKP